MTIYSGIVLINNTRYSVSLTDLTLFNCLETPNYHFLKPPRST